MPDWRLKALAQRAFSAAPEGHRLNELFQRHVTHGVPISDAKLAVGVGLARDHLERLAAHGVPDPGSGTFLEFGAGWDLHAAQVLWCLGVEHQVVVDIRPLARRDLVVGIARRLRDRAAELGLPRVPPVGPDDDLTAALGAMGIDYRAPADARDTGLPAGSIEVVTSTSTLEHIPAADIALILRECHRLLAADGRVSFLIDHRDHYASFDPSLSAYHFLRYDERAWHRWNPDLHFQNRLRHRDHLELIEAAGFAVLDEQVEVGTPADLADLRSLPLGDRFRGRSFEDLAICESRLVLAKR